MKHYRITLKNRKGEPLYITVTASSLYEAMKRVDFSSNWHFADYSVIGGIK
ncbi:MAG: hypothetical protein NC093_09120 [Alistipes sp.]|nr:hypothetical protein [Alistipes sp.]